MTYMPTHFEQTDQDEINAFLAANPFATLVVMLDGELWPTPLPLIHRPSGSGFGTFIGHVSLNNEMWKTPANEDALAIFQGPNTYITPNWYATKAETHEVVPTWNYAAVHAWGRITVHHDDKFKRMAVGLLTKIHESTNDIAWKMGDAPQEFLTSQLEGIVGFEFEVTRLKAKWKLNQNRTEADRAGVIDGLAARNTGDDSAIRRMMTLPNDPDAI